MERLYVFLGAALARALRSFDSLRQLAAEPRSSDSATTMARSSADQEGEFSKKDAMLGYKLLLAESPFPVDAVRAARPLMWKLAEGLSQGLSLHPGRQFMHLMALGSLRLNAVKVDYSGILGVFPNLLLIDVGASGDGKSIGLWMDTQVMHYLRKKILQARLSAWETAKAAFEAHDAAAGAPPPHPGNKPTWEELYDAGSVGGLGQQASENEGRVFWVKHEGKKTINSLLTGGPAGSMDDINALAEHAFAKNNPLNTGSRYRVENPHLCSYFLMHLEELVPLLESGKDTTAGLQRFRYLHFPPVVCKIKQARGGAVSGSGEAGAECDLGNENHPVW